MNVDAGMMKMGIRTNLNMWCHNPVFLQIIARFRTPPNFLLLESFAKENSYWALKLSTFHHRAVNLKTNSINLFEVSFIRGVIYVLKVFINQILCKCCAVRILKADQSHDRNTMVAAASLCTVQTLDAGVTPQQIDSG